MKKFANAEWQECGGSIEIPEGWFVSSAYFDTSEPYLVITNDISGEEKKVLFPKPIAYFLSMHFCGSGTMRNKLIEQGKREIRNSIKALLGL